MDDTVEERRESEEGEIRREVEEGSDGEVGEGTSRRLEVSGWWCRRDRREFAKIPARLNKSAGPIFAPSHPFV